MTKPVETNPSDWPSELQPKEMMFFSVDLVGSTAAKQKPIAPDEGLILDNSQWFQDIQSFYIKSVALFRAKCREQKEKDKNEYAQRLKLPRLWKTQGDEVLFWAEITDTRQVLVFIDAWKGTITELKSVMEKDHLDFKATAWIAHFPWRNKMIFTSSVGETDATGDGREDKNLELAQTYFQQIYAKEEINPFGLTPDFVGPGIDIGFRLSAQATQRRLVISTDVAYMIAEAATYTKRDIKDLKIHFEGLQILKGVLGGLEYPLFWIDLSDKPDDIYLYGHDLSRRDFCDREEIIRFMDSFYHQRHNYLYKPFVVSETECILRGAPEWYIKVHRDLLKHEGIVAE